jgi:hypothetical protein
MGPPSYGPTQILGYVPLRAVDAFDNHRHQWYREARLWGTTESPVHQTQRETDNDVLGSSGARGRFFLPGYRQETDLHAGHSYTGIVARLSGLPETPHHCFLCSELAGWSFRQSAVKA